MRLVLDTGALIAIDKSDRAMWRRIKRCWLTEEHPITHGGVVGQAWRGRGGKQALLAKALAGTEIRSLDDVLGRAAGELLAAAKAGDVIDAAVVLLARDGDEVATSDPDDIERLARTAGLDIEIVEI